MRVSPTNYADATRAATIIVSILYTLGGILVGFSTRKLHTTAPMFMVSVIIVLLLCNGIIYLFQRLSLPKTQLALETAISARDGEGFARSIIRREMAKAIQPTGGIAFSIGYLASIIACRLWH